MSSNRPIVGLAVDVERSSSNQRLFHKGYLTYAEAIWRAGGLPRLLAVIPEDEYLSALLPELDGLVMPGGDDLDPSPFGQDFRRSERFCPVSPERLRFDRMLLEGWLGLKRPFLGVCYGAQLLALMRGGRLIQDLPDERPDAEAHCGHNEGGSCDVEHGLIFESGSRIERIFGSREGRVNSFHHQAILEPGEGLVVTARAPDGIVEAIEARDPNVFWFGTQWHPERGGAGPAGDGVFDAFIAAARRARAARG